MDIFYPWFSASSIDSVCERQCLTTSSSSQLLLQKIRVAPPFLLTAPLLMIGVRCWCQLYARVIFLERQGGVTYLDRDRVTQVGGHVSLLLTLRPHLLGILQCVKI